MPQRSPVRRRVVLGLLLLLGACAAAEQPDMTREDYAALRTAMRGDAELRRGQTLTCIQEGSAASQAEREWLAEMLDSQSGDAIRIYCERLTSAFALEMVSYEDYIALKSGGASSAAALRILEAVRQVPDPRLTAAEFAALRELLAGDDAFRTERTQACLRELEDLWTPAERGAFATDLGVDPQNVVRAYCTRLNSAIASARLGYQEWQGLMDMDRYPEARERAMHVLRAEAEGA
jgi:hypothetical protein